jgi:GT2 family glycosyltransferase
MPDLSIVIVNYNTKKQLRECLDSIADQKGSLFIETIVVDNGSKDASATLVHEYAPAVRLIEPGYNSWFTGGNNLGVKAATADYVWILNPDTLVQADTMQKMLGYLKSHPETGAVTCLMRFPDGREQPTCSRTPRYLDLLLGYTFLGTLLSPVRNSRRKDMFYQGWERNSIKAVEVAPDSNLMLSRELFLKEGLFDEAMKLYFTEDDFCNRILKSGKEIHFLPDALLIHHEHASVEQVQRLASQVYFTDLVVFCRKYYGQLAAWFLQALVIPTRWAMDLKQRLRGEKKSLKV